MTAVDQLDLELGLPVDKLIPAQVDLSKELKRTIINKGALVWREDSMNAAELQAHEDAVAEFMRQAAEQDPERVADVCHRDPVLNEDALRYRRGREESLSAVRADWTLHAGLDGRRIN